MDTMHDRFKGLAPSAREVMMQLFVGGPTWDGHVVSKIGRDALIELELAERWDGFQQLTLAGLMMATDAEVLKDVSRWRDQRWYRKGTGR